MKQHDIFDSLARNAFDFLNVESTNLIRLPSTRLSIFVLR
jgi:hypothetical protein